MEVCKIGASQPTPSGRTCLDRGLLEWKGRLYPPARSRTLFEELRSTVPWTDGTYVAGGRVFSMPRLQAWYAEPGIAYRYGENLHETAPWTPLLRAIRADVERSLGVRFNALLINLYRDGADSVGWHADDEPDLGDAPIIGSLSLGAQRQFLFRHRKTGAIEGLLLGDGELLRMNPAFQAEWEHSVPSDPKVREARINLTFRRVVG